MTTYSVPEMSCGHCKAAIEKAVSEADPKAAISVDLDHRTVSIDSALPQPAILGALNDAGYAATPTS
jgi:copper chaperone